MKIIVAREGQGFRSRCRKSLPSRQLAGVGELLGGSQRVVLEAEADGDTGRDRLRRLAVDALLAGPDGLVRPDGRRVRLGVGDGAVGRRLEVRGAELQRDDLGAAGGQRFAGLRRLDDHGGRGLLGLEDGAGSGVTGLDTLDVGGCCAGEAERGRSECAGHDGGDDDLVHGGLLSLAVCCWLVKQVVLRGLRLQKIERERPPPFTVVTTQACLSTNYSKRVNV